MTDEQLQTIIKVAKRVAPKFAFGVYDSDDMMQEAIILGMECVERYDETRGPFENFVATHMSNRLRTFLRKHSAKVEPDCSTSSLDYIHWNRSFGAKKRLAEATPIDDLPSLVSNERDVCEILILNEIQELIDENLPVEYRADYLRMLNDIHVPKARRNKIKEIILTILSLDKEDDHETG